MEKGKEREKNRERERQTERNDRQTLIDRERIKRKKGSLCTNSEEAVAQRLRQRLQAWVCLVTLLLEQGWGAMAAAAITESVVQ